MVRKGRGIDHAIAPRRAVNDSWLMTYELLTQLYTEYCTLAARLDMNLPEYFLPAHAKLKRIWSMVRTMVCDEKDVVEVDTALDDIERIFEHFVESEEFPPIIKRKLREIENRVMNLRNKVGMYIKSENVPQGETKWSKRMQS